LAVRFVWVARMIAVVHCCLSFACVAIEFHFFESALRRLAGVFVEGKEGSYVLKKERYVAQMAT
jgi:hypothetical protein